MALPPESRRETLDKAMLEMVGQKKRLEAERAFLSDQLTQVLYCLFCKEGQQPLHRSVDLCPDKERCCPAERFVSTFAA